MRTLLIGIRDKTIIPNPHFQRRLVWSTMHKVAFLETVLDDLPFPEIFTAAGTVNPDTGDGTELIVDGQQRITTLYQYFTASSDLKLPSGMRSYAELPDDEKLRFLEYEVVVRDLGPLTEQETLAIFQRINSTKYSLNAMEVNNSRYDGALKKYCEALAADDFFVDHSVFTNLDGRRMNDVRFVLTMVITIMSGYFNRDDAHEEFLSTYNEYFDDDRFGNEFADVVRFIEACNLSNRSRAWQKADLLTLVVELHRAIVVERADLDPDQVASDLEWFYTEVEQVTHTEFPHPSAAEYFRRVRAGINDRASRINRGEIIGEVIRGRLGA